MLFLKEAADYRKVYHHEPITGHIYVTKQGKPIDNHEELGDPSKLETIPPERIWDGRLTRSGLQAIRVIKQSASSTMVDNSDGQPQGSPHWELSPIKENPRDNEIACDAMKLLITHTETTNLTKEQTDFLERKLGYIMDKLNRMNNPDNDTESIESDTTSNQLRMTEANLIAKEIEIETLQSELQSHKEELAHYKSNYNQSQTHIQETIKQSLTLQYEEFQKQLIELNEIRKSEAETMKSHIDSLHTKLKHQEELYSKLTTPTKPNNTNSTPTPYKYDKYPPPNNSSLDASLIQELSSHMSMQNTISKQHHLTSAKSYDGEDTKQFYPWIDEIERLATQLAMSKIEVAQYTARGPVHRYITELKTQAQPWETILSCLRERFSDCKSSAAAQSKLSKIKQEGRGMHIYVAEFQDLLQHAHNAKSTDMGTAFLANQFIEGIDISNKWLRNKLREKTGPHLEFYFQEALKLQASQNIRVLDYDTEKQNTECMEVQAIRSKTFACFNCNSPDHMAQECPEKDKRYQRHSQDKYNQQSNNFPNHYNKYHNNYKQQYRHPQTHPLENMMTDFLEKVNKLFDNQKPSQFNAQKTFKPKQSFQEHKQSYQSNKTSFQGKPNYKSDQKNNGYQKQFKPRFQRQHANTNAIEEYESQLESEYETENEDLISFEPTEDETKNL